MGLVDSHEETRVAELAGHSHGRIPSVSFIATGQVIKNDSVLFWGGTIFSMLHMPSLCTHACTVNAEIFVGN